MPFMLKDSHEKTGEDTEIVALPSEMRVPHFRVKDSCSYERRTMRCGGQTGKVVIKQP